MDDNTWAEITARLAADEGLPREALPLAHERGDKLQPRGPRPSPRASPAIRAAGRSSALDT